MSRTMNGFPATAAVVALGAAFDNAVLAEFDGNVESESPAPATGSAI